MNLVCLIHVDNADGHRDLSRRYFIGRSQNTQNSFLGIRALDGHDLTKRRLGLTSKPDSDVGD